ncbi:hypothetical protein NLG97_g4994 [Lecanicillium saksenae]|uniref:Uncharacterized protein n=1 Tax=Lecanicillium saksenae TaxID=468837 RepID=A0ACC1QXK9_9HYPO|nr:hypothetical protein NLG97_g4994 [Lecanicillium saksenae]
MDIWWLVAEQLYCGKDLSSLSRVNRTFNKILARKLWRYLEIDALNRRFLVDERNSPFLLTAENLHHARELVVNFKGLRQSSAIPENLMSLTALIERLANVSSVSIRDACISTELFCAVFLRQKLQHLSISFENDMERFTRLRSDMQALNDANAGFDAQLTKKFKDIYKNWEVKPQLLELPSFHLRHGFESLKYLRICNMFGNLKYWETWLLEILLGSPLLQHLILSIAPTTEVAYLNPSSEQPHRTFFIDLCHSYGKQTKCRLKLQTLRLGYPIQYPDLPALSVLTEAKYLRDIYMCHGSGQYSLTMADFRHYPLPFDVLSPKATPALSCLRVTSLTERLLENQDDIFDPKERMIHTFGSRRLVGLNAAAGIEKLVRKVPTLLLHAYDAEDSFGEPVP